MSVETTITKYYAIMSKIRVWTIDGRWSEEIKGLDKIHLIKEAILFEAHNGNWIPHTYLGMETGFYHLSYIEADGHSVGVSEDFLDKWSVDESVAWASIQDKEFNLKDVVFFSMRAYALKELVKNGSLVFSDEQKAILDKAASGEIPNDYCVLFKFDDE